MQPTEPARAIRPESWLAPEALAVVKRAAELQGRNVSDFVVAAVQEAAQRIIDQTSLLRLSAAEQRCFVDLLLNAPEPPPALRRARDVHAGLIWSSE